MIVSTPPESSGIAHYFLDARVEEGLGGRRAIVTDRGTLTYAEVQASANRFANALIAAGVVPEQRVLLALPDGPEYVAALFGIIKCGAVLVMVNPELKPDQVAYFYDYTRAAAVITDVEHAESFRAAADHSHGWPDLLLLGESSIDDLLKDAPATFENFPSHRDDAVIWLFSGGTTGRPKAVLQTHRSFINTTERYGKGVLGLTAADLTISVPKLYFGYATGSNLFFPFSVGAACVLFRERCTAEAVFEKITRHRPTVLVNVPTMINYMVGHPTAADQDLSCLRLATSAGEALPVELHERWMSTFGVELLDGLGTAEMWHVFLSNRPGDVRPGTLGRAVPGFDVRVRDEDGNDLPDGEAGFLWVKGDSRAIAYWQQMDQTTKAFRGEWYASEDMVIRDADGVFTYCGRGDDMLKVGGRWLAPQELENCLLQHPAVREVAVVGVADPAGLVKPYAFIVASSAGPDLAVELQEFARTRLEPYKYPREVVFVDSLPRTHLGKVDRARLSGRHGRSVAGPQQA